MSGNLSRYLAKALRQILQPPAITNSRIDKSSVVCSGSHINDSAMGRYSYIGHDCFFINVEVGAFCSIADGCRVGGAMHPIQRVSTSPVFHAGKNVMKKNFCEASVIDTPRIIIGNDVWIGANVCIKSGVKIGHGAVVGMGSVVTHDIEPYEIWAGVPAKRIRKRFSDEIVDKLLDLQWWTWDEKSIYEAAPFFETPEELIKKCGNEREK